MRRLLVLDDDELVGALVRRIGEGLGYSVEVSNNFTTFRDQYWEEPPHDIVLDLRLGADNGVEVLRFLSAQGCRSRITLLSAADGRTLESARQLGLGMGLNVESALAKPTRAAQLRAAIAPPSIEASITASELAVAIRNSEIVLVYQPIVYCASGKLAGIEALARWQRPNGERILPDRFIPLAESDPDLMDELTFAVGRRVIADWPALKSASFSGKIAINISAQNLRRLDFPERFGALFQDGDTPPDCITLELTETAATTNPLVTLDVLLRLRLTGFSLSIDDFGTGYSSLAMLRRLPYSELKIDSSFVKDIATSRDALAIVKAVLGMAQNMELETVAEGVDDKVVERMLAGLGVTFAQGFGICRPVGLSALIEWITTRAAPGHDKSVAGKSR